MPPSAPLGQQGNDYPFHALANIFPLLEGDSFTALVEDICAQGLREPVWLYEGQILDGRNRYRACQVAHVPYETRIYTGDDPIAFVVSMNLRRRHLDESQRGMVAARLATLERGANQHVEIPTPSQGQAAGLLNVSRDTVIQARKLQREGAPEVIAAVDTGEMSLTAALPLTELPRDVQSEAFQEAKREVEGKKPTATQTRQVVKRTQVVATVKEEIAAGKSPKAAVKVALKTHAIDIPTPALADAICRATDRQVTLPATDGYLHDGRTKQEEVQHAALTARLFQLFSALEALATLPPLAQLVDEIPAYCVYRIENHLDDAMANLQRFAALWKEKHV